MTMAIFKKSQKPGNREVNQPASDNIIAVRKEMAALKSRLSAIAKEKGLLQNALDDERKKHVQTKINLKKAKKQTKRMQKQRGRLRDEIETLSAENKNLKTRIRNSRARAKKYKERAESANKDI